MQAMSIARMQSAPTRAGLTPRSYATPAAGGSSGAYDASLASYAAGMSYASERTGAFASYSVPPGSFEVPEAASLFQGAPRRYVPIYSGGTISKKSPVSGPARYNIEAAEVVRNDAEATAIRVEITEVDALIGSLRRGNAELETLLAESNGEQSVLLNGQAQLQYQLDDLQSQLERGASQLAALPGQNDNLEATASSQMARIADLEARVFEHLSNRKISDLRERPADFEVLAGHGMSLEEVKNNLDPTCMIDAKILEFLHAHPDWHIGIDKVSSNYFQFGGPINKKVFIKLVGTQVLARVGGGYSEVMSWLEEQRLAFFEAEVLEDAKTSAASKRASAKAKAMRNSETMASGFIPGYIDRKRSSAIKGAFE